MAVRHPDESLAEYLAKKTDLEIFAALSDAASIALYHEGPLRSEVEASNQFVEIVGNSPVGRRFVVDNGARLQGLAISALANGDNEYRRVAAIKLLAGLGELTPKNKESLFAGVLGQFDPALQDDLKRDTFIKDVQSLFGAEELCRKLLGSGKRGDVTLAIASMQKTCPGSQALDAKILAGARRFFLSRPDEERELRSAKIRIWVHIYDSSSDAMRSQFDRMLTDVVEDAEPLSRATLCLWILPGKFVDRLATVTSKSERALRISVFGLVLLRTRHMCPLSKDLLEEVSKNWFDRAGRRSQPGSELFSEIYPEHFETWDDRESLLGTLRQGRTDSLHLFSRLYLMRFYRGISEALDENQTSVGLQEARNIEEELGTLLGNPENYRNKGARGSSSVLTLFAFSLIAAASDEVPSRALVEIKRIAKQSSRTDGTAPYAPKDKLKEEPRGIDSIRGSSARLPALALASHRHGGSGDENLADAVRGFRRHLPWLLLHAQLGGAHAGKDSLASYYAFPAMESAHESFLAYSSGKPKSERDQYRVFFAKAATWASDERGVFQKPMGVLDVSLANHLAVLGFAGFVE